MDAFRSSQAFVRALKGALDPPSQNGPTKLEIARKVWNDTEFYLPNKGEVITEWILNKFLKEKGNQPDLNPLLDTHHWDLLHDILANPTRSSRTLKAWLTPLLNRLSVAPILLSFLSLIQKQPYKIFSIPLAAPCFQVLWPQASQKLTIEALLDIFGVYFDALQTASVDELSSIGILLSLSFRHSFYNSSNKRKIHSTFLQRHYFSWLLVILRPDISPACSDLYGALYQMGIDVLFCLDVLRHELTPPLGGLLLSTLKIDPTKEVFRALPLLLKSYIESLRKYRGVLFDQSSSQSSTSISDVGAQGMYFFESCLQTLHSALESGVQAAETRLALLALVEKEHLFSYQSQRVGEITLQQLVDRIVDQREYINQDGRLVKAQVESLCTLGRIDFALLNRSWRKVSTSILLAPSSHHSYLDLINLVLDHHSRTKTLDVYINSFLSILETLTVPSDEPRTTYLQPLLGPFFHQAYLEQLSRHLCSFVTSRQVALIVGMAVHHLQNLWGLYEASAPPSSSKYPDGRPGKKKQAYKHHDMSAQASAAVRLCLISRTAEVVLSALPSRTLSKQDRADFLSKIQVLRRHAAHLGDTSLSKLSRTTNVEAWLNSIIAVANLRLWYALGLSNTLPESMDQIPVESVLDALQQESILPELRLELFRSLFATLPFLEEHRSQLVLESAISFLESHDWNLQAFQPEDVPTMGSCETEEDTCTLALVHLLFSRWLPTVQHIIRREHLARLVQTLFHNLDSSSSIPRTSHLDGNNFVKQLLHTADFWELGHVREVFITFLQSFSAKSSRDTRTVKRLVRLLSSVPPDYLPRSVQIEMIKTVLAADKTTSLQSPLDVSQVDQLIAMRLYLSRSLTRIASTNQWLDLSFGEISHLLTPELPKNPKNCLFDATTLAVIDHLWTYMFKSSSIKPDLIMHALSLYDNLSTNDWRSGKRKVLIRGFDRVCKVAPTDIACSSVHPLVSQKLHQLYERLVALVAPMLSDHASGRSPIPSTEILTLWHNLLTLRRRMNKWDDNVPMIGQSLIRQTSQNLPKISTSDGDESRALVSKFTILLEEVELCSGPQRILHVEFLIGAYLAFPSVKVSEDLMTKLAKTTRLLSVAEYRHICDILTEHISRTESIERLSDGIQAAELLLGEHPPGTLKQLQSLLSQCFLALVNHYDLVIKDKGVRRQMLKFMSDQATEHPAILRPRDMGPIWTILSRLLGGSCYNDAATSAVCFQHITTTIGALVRLRRDLVVSVLPLLGTALKQLILCLRIVRPQLGAKQIRLVADTQPIWLNSRDPLGVEDAKALSRLLQSLATKTVVRSYALSETQKTESLAKPFAKHAVYVVKAYSDAMNDPLCIIPYELRRELEHGLFALLGMINEHDRNALMVTTPDAGGKSTIKALWKEYEKEKYVGKG